MLFGRRLSLQLVHGTVVSVRIFLELSSEKAINPFNLQHNYVKSTSIKSADVPFLTATSYHFFKERPFLNSDTTGLH